MLSTMVKYRKVPKLLDRSAMLEMLLHEEYGYLPPAPDSISYTSETMVKNFCASKATFEKIQLTPRFVKEIGYAKGEIQTEKGKIAIDWKYENGKFVYNVEIPSGINATYNGKT